MRRFEMRGYLADGSMKLSVPLAAETVETLLEAVHAIEDGNPDCTWWEKVSDATGSIVSWSSAAGVAGGEVH